MKKYFALTWTAQTGTVEIVRETETSVYIACHEPWANGARREAKISDGRGYFDTWKEARDFLILHEATKIAALTDELARRQGNVRKIEEMTE